MAARVIIIGGNVPGVQAALDLADSGIEVTLLEESYSLPESPDEGIVFRPRLLKAARHPNIRIMTGTEAAGIDADDGSYRVRVIQHPRYVGPQACLSCGRCERACPVVLFSEDNHKAQKAIHRPPLGLKSIPSSCIIDKTGVAPCTAACPAGINVQGYVALISRGRLREALDLVREANPFPHILGRVCTHPCEEACTRGSVDQPIAIASLKRYLADMEPRQYSLIPTGMVNPDSPRRVAVIGSGPAGLTCARDLAWKGHNSTIFEALPVPGGMVAVGMPRFRLPREVREAEINAILHMGVEIRTNTAVGPDLTLNDLKEQGYEAVFIASGAHINLQLNIPGEELDGVIDSITLLRKINLKQPVTVGSNVVVIGGGYTAIDSARTAIRLNQGRVRVLYRRTEKEMAATKAEILETTEEGVEVEILATPVRIIGEEGRVVGIECQRMELGEMDETGRRRPVPVEGSNFVLDCDTVIVAIGQQPDLSIYDHGRLRPQNNGNTIDVDPLTLQTSVPGVFAGGDVTSGPRSMVHAVGDGRRAAVSIDRLLQGLDLAEGRLLESPAPVEVDLEDVHIVPRSRRRIPVLPVEERVGNFEEVQTGYTTFMALRESKRCLNCGGCSECFECVKACEQNAIDHEMRPVEMDLNVDAVIYAAGDSPGEDIYTIGEGDIPDMLSNASAIVSKVLSDLADKRPVTNLEAPPILRQEQEPAVAGVPVTGVFVCRCGGGISDVVDISGLVVYLSRRHDVALAHPIDYACSDEGAMEIRNVAKDHGLTHAVVAACACCGLDQICFSCSDRRIECKDKLLACAGQDGLRYEFVNIREHCSWVHARDHVKAMAKATALIRAGLTRLIESPSDSARKLPVKQSVAVIGAGVSGLRAAASLTGMNIQVNAVIESKRLSGDIKRGLIDDIRSHGGEILEDMQLKNLDGLAGDYTFELKRKGKAREVTVGAVIIDLDGISINKLPELLQLAVRQTKSEPDQFESCVPGVFICGAGSAGKDTDSATLEGMAIAGKVAAFLGRGMVHTGENLAIVNPSLCRGCGTCTTICEFGAPRLIETDRGIFISQVDEVICRGCGTCVAHCPSGAIEQQGLSDSRIAGAMEAILLG